MSMFEAHAWLRGICLAGLLAVPVLAESLDETREVVQESIRELRSFDETSKADAVKRLVAIGQPAVPALQRALPHVSDRDAVWIVRALRQIGDPRAAFPVMDRYAHSPLDLKEEILASLASFRVPGAIGFLTTVLLEPEARLRRRAAAALARLDNPGAIRGLLRSVEDEDDWVRTEAVAGLMRLSERVSPSRIADPLVRRVSDLSDGPLCDTLRVLAALGDTRIREPLRDNLRLGDEEMRCLCARALGRLADSECATALERALDDPSEGVRAEVVRSLVVARGYECFRVLARRLDVEESRSVTQVIRRSLRKFVGRDLGPRASAWLEWERDR